MIDQQTSIQWAKEAGAVHFTNWSEKNRLQLLECELQKLIARAMNEAYEKAAQQCDSLSDLANHPDDVNGYGCAAAIRLLKVCA